MTTNQDRPTGYAKYYGRVDLVCDVLSIVCLLAAFGLLAWFWPQLPERIPQHYNAAGQIDGWGGRGSIFVMPVMSLALFIVMSAVRLFPDSAMNLPVRMTAENHDRLMRLGYEMLGVIKAAMMLLFAVITGYQVTVSPLPLWFLPFVLFLVLAPVIFYIIRMVKNK